MRIAGNPLGTPPLEPAAAKILCVDDEPEVLTGLRLQLRRRYQVLAAESGEQGLALLDAHPDVAVILSDMRMPGMDGATFLGRARKQAPQAVRLLLTGYADTQAAIRAVNQGHLFRFLTKPCAPEELRTVMRAAAAQHRLLVAERELLDETLTGSIEALSDILSIALPEVYGGLGAIRRVAEAMGQEAGLEPIWPLRVAAMLVYVGHVALPREVAARAVAGEQLTEREARIVGHAPQLAAQLLSRIPRLEPVCAIISGALDAAPVAAGQAAESDDAAVGDSAAILRLAIDYCRLLDQEVEAHAALDRLSERVDQHAPWALNLLREHVDANLNARVIEIDLKRLRVGMVLADGLRTRKGVLVAARGYIVSQGFLERIRNYPKDSLAEPVRVRWTDAGE